MANRETKTLSFTPEQSAFLAACIDSGRYLSASEVVRAALRLLQDQEADRQAELERVRALIQQGSDELELGQVVDGEAFFRELAGEDERLREEENREAG